MKLFFNITLLLSLAICSDKVFVVCEGNYYDGNQGTLWTIENDEPSLYNNSTIGSVPQSLLVHNDLLFVAVNGSGNIQVYQISEESLDLIETIDTNSSGPREMIVFNNYLYFTNWYSQDLKKINLSNWELESSASMPGLPEDIVYNNGLLYVSITMNSDWTDGNLVVSVNPYSDEIVETFDVGEGPGALLVYDDEIFVSRTYYDANWNAFYGTSKIKDDGSVIEANYGAGAVCGGGIYKFQNSVYRVYNGGLAMINEDLEIMPETRLGNYNSWEVYSADVIGDFIYFGLSDFSDSDEVAVVDLNGQEVSRYTVGSIPGDFAYWNSCSANGDINADGYLNIADIVMLVNFILEDYNFDCDFDFNQDNQLNVTDIVLLVQEILGIESFSGAANWLRHHFPKLMVDKRLNALDSVK